MSSVAEASKIKTSKVERVWLDADRPSRPTYEEAFALIGAYYDEHDLPALLTSHEFHVGATKNDSVTVTVSNNEI